MIDASDLLGSQRRMQRSASQFSLLGGLPDAAVRDFFKLSCEKKLKSRDTLFHQDDAGAEGYLVVSGAMRVERLNAEGGRVLLNIIGPGEFFGETAILTGNTRSAALVAQTNATLRSISKADFHTLLMTHPLLSEKLLGRMGQRLAEIGHKLEEVSLMPLPCRLAGLLLEFMRRFGTEGDGSGTIDIKLTQSDLGELISSSREHVNKVLKIWMRDGLVRIDAGRILLLDIAALEQCHENITL